MAKPEKVLAATLVLDFNLYPRLKVNDGNVTDLRQAVACGAVLPPVVADRDSRRVADGFHRVTAALRDSPEATIDVEFRDYPTDADLFADAVRMNASHGFKLNAIDATRIVHLGRGFGMSLDQLASAMHTPVEELERRGKMIAVLASPSRRQVRNQEVVPLKRTFANLAGRSITEAQQKANSSATGHPQSFLIQQVINIIEADALDVSNPVVVERIARLRGLVDALEIAA